MKGFFNPSELQFGLKKNGCHVKKKKNPIALGTSHIMLFLTYGKCPKTFKHFISLFSCLNFAFYAVLT